MREHVVQNELPIRLVHPLYHASWFVSLSLALAIVYVVMLIQNFNQFSTNPRSVVTKLGRNILALLVIMFAILYIRTFAHLHAIHDENHRKLLRKSIIDLQLLKLKYDSRIEETRTNAETGGAEVNADANTDPNVNVNVNSEMKEDSLLRSELSEQDVLRTMSPKEKSKQCEDMISILEKIQEFQEGLDPLYIIRVFGYPVIATPAIVDTITGTIGAYIAIIFTQSLVPNLVVHAFLLYVIFFCCFIFYTHCFVKARVVVCILQHKKNPNCNNFTHTKLFYQNISFKFECFLQNNPNL
ncbi:hypothetical protein RFI_25429 [Reticulomyxa filosa]|uniref:Uncharacterized protein n=1 Tax=Reticulomyxa filosa TaxID=46433 RepID=X6MD65_RETFI|nr:hypothetical protein RFI_25429 [Reticulomyxa filosa]|eukprot:ETO11948.1 hypothetical protein RFI_25429 [Reticulomyxa filosa]